MLHASTSTAGRQRTWVQDLGPDLGITLHPTIDVCDSAEPPISTVGSGVKSVPLPKLLSGIKSVFGVTGTANLQIATQTMPLSEIEEAWKTPDKPRIVVTVR